MTNKDFAKLVAYSQPITINGIEYAEPTLVGDFCDSVPFIQAPVYQVRDFESGNDLYIGFNARRRILAVDENMVNAQCAACGLKCGLQNPGNAIVIDMKKIKGK